MKYTETIYDTQKGELVKSSYKNSIWNKYVETYKQELHCANHSDVFGLFVSCHFLFLFVSLLTLYICGYNAYFCIWIISFACLIPVLLIYKSFALQILIYLLLLSFVIIKITPYRITTHAKECSVCKQYIKTGKHDDMHKCMFENAARELTNKLNKK